MISRSHSLLKRANNFEYKMEETPLNEDDLSTEYPAMAEDEEDEEEDAAPVVVTPAVKKRGRPSGSKNRAPDIYTTLLDRMSQLEETLNRRQSQSSTGGTIEKKRTRNTSTSDKTQETTQTKGSCDGTTDAPN